MIGFRRIYECTGCGRGGRAHVSFPLGIHPVGQMLARAASPAGIAVNWAGSGTTTPSVMQLELIDRLKPTIWMGMSSYGLHLANLAEARGIDLARGSVETILCSAEPMSDAKRAKLQHAWGATVRDTFGMTEAGMMGAEDQHGGGFRVWTDMFLIEVLDPDTLEPVKDGDVGTLVVSPLWTNNVTPFLRWSSGDLVTMLPGEDGGAPFSVFPLVKHAHRTTGFFKVRGININHADLEDFIFRHLEIADFKAELLTSNDLDVLRLSIEAKRGADGIGDRTLRFAKPSATSLALCRRSWSLECRHARQGIRVQRQIATLCRPAAMMGICLTLPAYYAITCRQSRLARITPALYAFHGNVFYC